MEFSVIIPVFHGDDMLRKSLESASLLKNHPNEVEIVVVYPSDEIRTERIVSEYSGISPFRVIGIPLCSKNRSQMLNTAVKQSSGNILAFIDDDCLVPPDWLHTVSDSFLEAEQCGIVGGRDVPAGNRKAFDESLDVVLSSFWGTAGTRAPRSRVVGRYFPRLWNMALSRSSLEILSAREHGKELFNTNLEVHEDVDLGQRMKSAGLRLCYNPQLFVNHYRDTKFWMFVARNYSMGYTSRILGVYTTHHRLLAIGICLVIISIPASLIVGIFEEILTIVAVLFGTICLSTIIVNIRKIRSLATIAWIPFVLSGLYLSRAVGYLSGSINSLAGKAGNKFREQTR